MPEIDVNILAVVVSAVAFMALGFFWYSNVLFGKQWRKLSGMNADDIHNAKAAEMTKNYVLSFIAALVTAFILSVAIDYARVDTLKEGIEIGFIMWLGFVGPVQLTGNLYSNKSWKFFVLQTGYQLTGLLIMGIILGLWT